MSVLSPVVAWAVPDDGTGCAPPGSRAPLRRGPRRARRARRTRARSPSCTTGSAGTAYGLAYRILRDEALAEDAVQEAFLGLWRSAASFVPERAKASTWVLTLVHRRAVDLVRREQRRRAEPLDGARPSLPAARPRRPRWLRLERERVQAALAPAAGRAAGGDRARLLRRLHAVRAGRAARRAARHDQEQDVHGPRAAARAARRRHRRGTWTMPHELTAGYALDALDAGRARALRGAPRRRCERLPRGAAGLLAGRRARSPTQPPARRRHLRCASGSSRRRVPSGRTSSRSARAAARCRLVVGGRRRGGGRGARRSGSGRPRSPATSTTRRGELAVALATRTRAVYRERGRRGRPGRHARRATRRSSCGRSRRPPTGRTTRSGSSRTAHRNGRACSRGPASPCSRGRSGAGRRSRSRSSRTAALDAPTASRSSPPRRRSSSSHVPGAPLASRRPWSQYGGTGPQPERRERRQPLAEPGSAGREREAARGVGGMFWLRRKRLSGSYFRFSACSRSYFSGP